MHIPLSWLEDFIDISDLSPSVLAEKLTLAGLEVEAIQDIAPPFTGVVVGKVVSCEPHPEAERLQVAKVSDGDQEYQVVCGAPNCREGLVTAFAKIGARLPTEEGKTFKIKKSKLRGIESQGMLCSEIELQAGSNHDGIIELNGEYSVGSVYGEELKETVFEIALTPNLAHCMSVYGVARELSAILGRPLNCVLETPVEEEGESIKDQIKVSVEDSKGCPRYATRLVKDVKIAASPDWIKRRIESAGMRSVNNVVDITNYLLLELGHPLHAFDYDKISDRKIYVRKADEGERFTTLDDQEQTLKNNDLLICDGKGPVAIAGVMGGQRSEVTETTQNVLLESAYFKPQLIGPTARRLGLLTESAARFERGTDPHNVIRALDRAAKLLHEIAGGEIVTGRIDEKVQSFPDKKIGLRLSRVCSLLGVSLVQGEVQETIERFGFLTEWQSEDLLVVWVPPYRHDLNEEVDLIEEVARIYGYENLPKTVSRYRTGKLPDAPLFVFESEVRRRLTAFGLQEILTSDLIGPSMLREAPHQVTTSENLIKVANPTSQEQSILRPSLLPGILEVIAHNLRHQERDIAAFEIGRVYGISEEKRVEQSMMAIALTGDKAPFFPDEFQTDWDFYDIKGILEQLIDGIHVRNVRFEKSDLNLLHPGRQATLHLKNLQCGTVGEVHPALLKDAGIEQRVLFATVNLEELLAEQKPKTRMEALAAYPASERDWTLTVEEGLPVQVILSAIKEEAPRILESAELRSIYRPESGGKNVTIRVRYRDSKKTLAQAFVDKQHTALCERVETKI